MRNSANPVHATRTVVARDYRAVLARFAERSRGAGRALLYITGHGTEPAGGPAYLLPPDLDRVDEPQLSAAIPLDEVARALRTRRVNLLLHAGCRERGLPGTAPAAVPRGSANIFFPHLRSYRAEDAVRSRDT